MEVAVAGGQIIGIGASLIIRKGDRNAAVGQEIAEPNRVISGAAHDTVVFVVFREVEIVLTRPAEKRVRPGPAGQRIIANAAIDHIIVGPRDDEIVACLAIDGVIATRVCLIGAKAVIARAQPDTVIAQTAKDRIVIGTGINDVIPIARDDAVIARTRHDVVTVAQGAPHTRGIVGIDKISVRIPQIGRVDHIIAACALDDPVRGRGGRGGQRDKADIAIAGCICDLVGEDIGPDGQ